MSTSVLNSMLVPRALRHKLLEGAAEVRASRPRRVAR
jgi:hypothetical protein